MQKLILLFVYSTVCIIGAAQNVGIGTNFPNNAQLVIKNPGNNSGFVINDSTTGISFGESLSPTVCFNNYYRSGRKFMADGYGSYFFFNPGNGTLFYNNTATSGVQGGVPVITTRFSINKDGEVGIGISEAQAGLHIRSKSLLVENSSGFSDVTINANTSTTGGQIELQNNTGIRTVALRAGDGSGISGELIFYNSIGTSTLELDGDYGGSGKSRIIANEVYVHGTAGTTAINVTGNICVTGTVGACSDIRYKTNLQPLHGALAAVMAIQPLYYNWKKEFANKGFGNNRQLGFSAQEIERLFPEIVQTDSKGYKAVDYSRMTPVLVQAVKEQQQQIEELKKNSSQLEARLLKLERLIANK